MKPTTQGETLFILLRDDILGSIGHSHQNWSNFQSLLSQVSGNRGFGDYYRGATAIYLMRRLLRHWEHSRFFVIVEKLYVKKMVNFINEDGLTRHSASD